MPSTQKPCHNCRRRRLRCDRSWPTCHKCVVSGQECLGYGKVFVWAQNGDGQNRPKQQAAASTARQTSPTHDDTEHVAAKLLRQSQASLSPPPESSRGSSPTALVDPLFQDLDNNSRRYLAHFADRVCLDLVPRDKPGGNPFRELIPLAKHHPLLLQILIATSAVHWSNLLRPVTAVPNDISDPASYFAQLRNSNPVSRQALIDALDAKQKAMGHLRDTLGALDPAGSEVALASMHFFIKFELIDLDQSGRSNWKSHLEGAGNIMALLKPGKVGPESSRILRDTIVSDCFIYHILGSTLSSGGLANNIAQCAFELLPVMQRVELTSYLSCPPEILQVILSASQLSGEQSHTDLDLSAADKALALIDQAISFDIHGWAAQLRRLPEIADIESRMHIASAHRAAACLYIVQALPLVRAVRPVSTDYLVNDIVSHLGAINEDDPYFKATSWPTFIAGAETRDPEKRKWALQRLMAIWEKVPWGYIFTAIEMLKATWSLQDNQSGPSKGVNWLQDLKGMGYDSLIV